MFYIVKHYCLIHDCKLYCHPYCSLYIFNGADKEDLSKNQKLLAFVIISFILMTLMCNSGVILLGERRCL